MKRTQWHILRDGAALTLARRLPARFDFAAETFLPRGSRLRLATQIRQDMWRELQGLRGFSPVVRIVDEGDALRVTAGGAVQSVFAKNLVEEKIAGLLADPGRRARWSRYAAHRNAAQNV